MWLDNLKELKKEKGMSSKQIAEKTNLPERTVIRIFAGDTDNPYVDTLRRIVAVLGGSLDDLFAESKIVVASQDLVAAQEEVNRLNQEIERLNQEIERLNTEIALLTTENTIIKDKNVTLSSEVDLLRLKLEHKEEIIALHNHYKSLMSGLTK